MSVLQKPEVRAKYHSHFIAAHADFSELELDDNDPRHAMVKRHNPRKLRPVLVFLNPEGKEVARINGGLKSVEDGLLLDRFVNEKQYLQWDFKTFRAANSD